jgi:hypothetical protein
LEAIAEDLPNIRVIIDHENFQRPWFQS